MSAAVNARAEARRVIDMGRKSSGLVPQNARAGDPSYKALVVETHYECVDLS
jgi:hypothetical protein